MINLDTPRKHATLIDQAHQLAMNMLRPISRTYDRHEHTRSKDGSRQVRSVCDEGAEQQGPDRDRRDRRDRGADREGDPGDHGVDPSADGGGAKAGAKEGDRW